MRSVNIARTSDFLNRGGRGLSPLQHALLTALPAVGKNPVRTGDLLHAIGLHEPSNADRAVVTRSLVRLEKRGLALRWKTALLRLPGNGYLWGRA